MYNHGCVCVREGSLGTTSVVMSGQKESSQVYAATPGGFVANAAT